MTTNLGGFDDFQGMSLWRDSDWTSSTVPIGANTIGTLVYDRGSSFSSMRVRGGVTGAGLQMQFLHARTAGDLNPILTHQFVILPGVDFLCTVPMISNFFIVRWRSAIAAPAVLDIGTQQLNIGSDIAHWYSPVHELGIDALVLATGSSQNFVLPSLFPGPASLYFRADGAPASVRCVIDTLDENGALLTRVAKIHANDPTAMFYFQAPQTYWRATISNNSGANQTHYLGISIQGV